MAVIYTKSALAPTVKVSSATIDALGRKFFPFTIFRISSSEKIIGQSAYRYLKSNLQ